MNIRMVIVSALAMTGCTEKPESSGEGCDAETDSFDLEVDLAAETIVQQMINQGVDSLNDINCYLVCSEAIRDTYGWEIVSDDSCALSFTISEAIDTGADGYDPQASVGTLACSGEMTEYFCLGRRPMGHVERYGVDYLTRCAHLEAASVDAFVELIQRLTRWNAPQELIQRAKKAAAEEVIHAALFARLAGIQTIPTCEKSLQRQTLFDTALHNAVEGCVWEAWAALLARVQALHTQDPTKRRVYARVAADETEHAQLSWDLHHWFLEQLSEPERQQICAAQREALQDLVTAARKQEGIPPVRENFSFDWEGIAHHFVDSLAS